MRAEGGEEHPGPELRLSDGGDTLEITGPLSLRGRLRVPGDKSISHRALIFAAIANGDSQITSLGTGEDIASTRRLLRSLGVAIRGEGSATVVEGRGFDGLSEPKATIHCGNSGTTLRLGAGLVAGRPFMTILTGDASLRRRPMRRIIEPLKCLGAHISGADDDEVAPLLIKGGHLVGKRVEVSTPSAQVKGCLILAALQARGKSSIVVPSATRDHSERILSALGARVTATEGVLEVEASEPRSFEIDVPGDLSSAIFLMIAAASCPGSEVVIERVGVNPTRTAPLDALAEMGVDFELSRQGEVLGEPFADITVRYSPELCGTERQGAEIALLIDEIPALAALGARANGESVFRDAGELRAKESDRIAAIASEVGKLGPAVSASTDSLTVSGGAIGPATVVSHGDHRIALALASVLSAVEGRSRVKGYRAAAVSYPEFARDLASLAGIKGEGLDLAEYAEGERDARPGRGN